jgi:hypothetical protein
MPGRHRAAEIVAGDDGIILRWEGCADGAEELYREGEEILRGLVRELNLLKGKILSLHDTILSRSDYDAKRNQ